MKNLFKLLLLLLFNYVSAQQSQNYNSDDIKQYKRKADFTVVNKKEILNALKVAKPYNIIYVKGNVTIDLSGEKNIEIKEGIKLIGDRNTQNKVSGAILFTKNSGIHPLFNVNGDNVLIYGLTIKGDDGRIFVKENAFKGKTEKYIKSNYSELYNKNMYATPVSSGVATKKKNLIIDNCELFQWTYTAVYVQKGAQNVVIKNSYIHHNQRFGLGYGITVDRGEVFIKGNTFDYNGHSVASTGLGGSRYIVEKNVFYQNGKENSWAVDMHGGKDRNDGSDLAGDYLVIRDNVFYLTAERKAIVIRGVPKYQSVIENNIIYKDKRSVIENSQVIEQINGKGNLEIKNNKVKAN